LRSWYGSRTLEAFKAESKNITQPYVSQTFHPIVRDSQVKGRFIVTEEEREESIGLPTPPGLLIVAIVSKTCADSFSLKNEGP
jgi:hypothetical protein